MSQFFKTKREVVAWLKKMGIANYRIHKDLSVDVMEDVDLRENGLACLPVQFDVVYGKFSCSENHLESLKGSPNEVHDSFYCANNQLRTLEGGPRTVGNLYFCEYNPLESLEGAPETIHGSFFSPFQGEYLKPQIKALAEKGIVVKAFNFHAINAEVAAEALAKGMSNVLDKDSQETIAPKRRSERI